MVKIMLFLIASAYSLYADGHIEKKRVFILHSYAQEYKWSKSQHEGFVLGLQALTSQPIEFSTEYLDTKRRVLTTEYQDFFLEYLQKKYQDHRPDAIYISDDDALRFFVKYRESIFPDVPLFFSGVNDLAFVTTLDKSAYKGVVETKDIVPNIELIRQFSPQTREVWFVGDASSTYSSIESEIKRNIKHYPKHRFHFISSQHIDDILDRLPKDPRSFVILTTIGELKDDKGETLALSESIALLRKKPNIIILSMEDAYIMEGVVGGYVTSGHRQGEEAARLVYDFFEGRPLREIVDVSVSPNIYKFDRRALTESRLILSEYIARNAQVVHEEKKAYERYQEVIFDFLFLFFLALVIAAIFFYYKTLIKRRQCDVLQKAFDALRERLQRLQIRTDLLEQDCDMGTWEWDEEERAFTMSESLRRVLQTKNPIGDLKELISYVHPKDVDGVDTMIDNVISRKVSRVRSTHQMIDDEGRLFKVSHTVGSIVKETGIVLLGVVKVIDEA